jgi:hypothetical protein
MQTIETNIMKTELTDKMIAHIKSLKTISINGKLFQFEEDSLAIKDLCGAMSIPHIDVNIYVNDSAFPLPELQTSIKIEHGDRFEIMRRYVHGG